MIVVRKERGTEELSRLMGDALKKSVESQQKVLQVKNALRDEGMVEPC